jgi:hypothetical protein
MKPATSAGARRSTAFGPGLKSQYGQVLSLVLMKARQFGHMRRFSTDCHCTDVFKTAREQFSLIELELP